MNINLNDIPVEVKKVCREDAKKQVELYMEEWLSEQDVYTLEAWNEVKDAVMDSLS